MPAANPLTKLELETLKVEIAEDDILKVTLNRPADANALNTQMARDLIKLFFEIEDQPGLARVIVMTGSGDRFFCAGGDLKERNGMTNEAWLAQHRLFERAFWAVVDCALPVIGCINGHAFGGGLEFALCCDFAYAAKEARFALPEVKLGIMPGGGGTQNMNRAAGVRRAKELILTGREFTADKGVQWNIFNEAYPRAELMDKVMETARMMAANAPISVVQAKKAIQHGSQMDLTRAFWFEIEAYNRMVFTEDRLEGVKAFNEKRKPKYKGK